ncbi:MAG: class I SAM-dependent methyltransferase [Planctomycetota bacterium]|nr:class I SAM-dependent methyltransferase [Planctomycetota bacterium]MDA1214104.1 class I SAM-dependent methyltransferase [Planctomycetota bacterium]
MTDDHEAECELLRGLKAAPELLAEVAEFRGSEFAAQDKLRRRYPVPLVQGAFALWDLRRKAEAKFSRAHEMWFDRVGLEQSTGEQIARHIAQRYSERIYDFCSGIGGDSIALAERGDVIAVDYNPAQSFRTKWNAEVYGVADCVQPICSAVEDIRDRNGWLRIDPDRRPGAGGRRAIRIEEMQPAYEAFLPWMEEFPGGSIKLSPASNFLGKFSGSEIELVSLNGECKEATVWFGALASVDAYRATVLPSGESIAGNPLAFRAEISPLLDYIYDPDPAVVRAGLVDLLAETLSLKRLDDAEEYLTSSQPVVSPFVQTFVVQAELPNHLPDLRAHFRANAFREVEIKCRHLSVDASHIRRKLDLKGDRRGVIIYAKTAGKSRVVIADRWHPNPAGS